jgi:hypothetical protein
VVVLVVIVVVVSSSSKISSGSSQHSMSTDCDPLPWPHELHSLQRGVYFGTEWLSARDSTERGEALKSLLAIWIG